MEIEGQDFVGCCCGRECLLLFGNWCRNSYFVKWDVEEVEHWLENRQKARCWLL